MRQGGEGWGERRKMNVSVTMGGATAAWPHQWEGRFPGRTASKDENESRGQFSVEMFSPPTFLNSDTESIRSDSHTHAAAADFMLPQVSGVFYRNLRVRLYHT